VQTVTASAPGRVNLIGEHLDYNGGRCLPIAIDRRTSVRVRRAATTVLTSSDASPGWERYVHGVLGALEVQDPVAVEVSSDVPIGAGLASSAALTCATALALDALLGLGLGRDQLVTACVRAENEYVGAPTGGMDQTVSLHAGVGTALLLDFADGSRRPVALDPGGAGLRLLVLDTGVGHALADGRYAQRREECRHAADLLGVARLVDARPAAVATLADPVLRARARHVVGEQARVTDVLTALAAGRWHTVGALLNASHASLRDDFAVSCDELDTAVAAALGAGARGARMTGGGFGGSAIALVPDVRVEAVAEAVHDAFARNRWEAPTVFAVEASRDAAVDQVT
jgi:galactokinase